MIYSQGDAKREGFIVELNASTLPSLIGLRAAGVCVCVCESSEGAMVNKAGSVRHGVMKLNTSHKQPHFPHRDHCTTAVSGRPRQLHSIH